MRHRLTTLERRRHTRRALERFERFLVARAQRLTPARAAIVEAALARDGHFAIEALVADLRRHGIRGSKATVYRVLPLLTEAGILQEAVFTGETRSYEAALGARHHDHLLCRACGQVVEFQDQAIEVLQREVAVRHGFTLDGHHLQLVGRCSACTRSAARAAGRAHAQGSAT